MSQNRPPKQRGREWAFSGQLSLTVHGMFVVSHFWQNGYCF